MLKCWCRLTICGRILCIESDKEPSPWTLTYSLYDKDTACAVVAAKDADTYLVEAGVQDTAAVQADDGASKYVSTGERRYALISKADYWSGNANYRDFEKSADTQASLLYENTSSHPILKKSFLLKQGPSFL